MKQLIGLTRSSALTAGSVVSYQETLATKTLERGLPREGELVLLGIDGTVIAREINLAPHAGYDRVCSEQRHPIYISPHVRLTPAG